MSTRTQLIARIRDLNASADARWLAQFSTDALQRYLAHLELTLEPRGTAWTRPGDTPVVMTRTPAA